MAGHEPTPVEYVAEPMRLALDGIVAKGTLVFAGAAIAVAVTIMPVDRGVRILTYHVLPGLLAHYVLSRFIPAPGRRHVAPDSAAWDRARELDPSDTRFARVIQLIVPAGTLLAGAALLCPHLADPDDQARVLGVFLPLFVLLWVGVTFAWIDECRGRLAAAAADSDRRFRAYWAGIGRA